MNSFIKKSVTAVFAVALFATPVAQAWSLRPATSTVRETLERAKSKFSSINMTEKAKLYGKLFAGNILMFNAALAAVPNAPQVAVGGGVVAVNAMITEKLEKNPEYDPVLHLATVAVSYPAARALPRNFASGLNDFWKVLGLNGGLKFVLGL